MRFILIIVLLIVIGCQSDQQDAYRYLVVGHTYQWGVPDNNRIDRRLEKMDFGKYDQIWLGGDLCARTSERPATLAYLDSIFQISQPNVHWTIGNHDLTSGDLQNILDRTRRPSFYPAWINGLQLLVLNTSHNHPQLAGRNGRANECDSLQRQYKMIRVVCDTISTASHLVLLHHHNLLDNELTDGKLDMDSITNFFRPNLDIACEPKGNFAQLVYPFLKKVQERGIQVVMIGGDFGQRHKGFQFQTADGIWFLGSGINNSVGKGPLPAWVTNIQTDSLLIMEHRPAEASLRWWFEALPDE